ncbi:MAG: sugar kinase [Armatimonadetes bacterium]|nr:sugar kinase [Armatimonadota bacterium]
MAEVLIVGSMALDTIETPFGRGENIVGGADVYSAIAASFFAPVNLIGVVGDDYPQESLDFLADRGISLDGVVVVPGGKTFRWAGRYQYDMSSAETLDTQLGVFADFAPRVPESYHHSRYVFLANILPSVQLAVIEQIGDGCFVIADTMNFWIERARDDLYKVLERVDLMLLNDSEARQLTGQPNLARAAEEILKMGPRYVVIKKGEYGATLVSEAGGSFTLPCYPLQDVRDPTGAGDSFAGGFIGYLAWAGQCGDPDLRQATAIGTVMASRCVESFGLDTLAATTTRDIYDRYFALKHMVEFQELPEGL